MQPTRTPRDPAQPHLIRASLALIAIYALILTGGPETSELVSRVLGIAIDAYVLVAICDLPAQYQPVAYACYRIARRLVRTLSRKSPAGNEMADHPGLIIPAR